MPDVYKLKFGRSSLDIVLLVQYRIADYQVVLSEAPYSNVLEEPLSFLLLVLALYFVIRFFV